MGCTPPPLRHVLVNVSGDGGQVSSSHQGSDPSPLSPAPYSLGRPLRRTLSELVIPGFIWQDCAAFQFSPSLYHRPRCHVLCCPAKHLGGGCALGLRVGSGLEAPRSQLPNPLGHRFNCTVNSPPHFEQFLSLRGHFLPAEKPAGHILVRLQTQASLMTL